MTEKVRESFKKINLPGTFLFDEPMSKHCTFKVGGPADIFYRPVGTADLRKALEWAADSSLPWFILGGGANIVPADLGVRGLVIDMSSMNHLSFQGNFCQAQAGGAISDISAKAADAMLGGLEFIYAMPGSLGGAVYMNARCYDSEMSAIVREVEYLDEQFQVQNMQVSPADFSYKQSPFTGTDRIITEVRMELRPAYSSSLWQRMKELEADRKAKGHFDAPCAGSVFKNNHEFGAPSGKLIDGLGLRGYRIGGACISPRHANIIINDAQGTASDIRALTNHVFNRVKTELGFALEPEILFVGNW